MGLAAIQMATSEIMKEAKSVRRWAASVAMARLLDRTPPTTSPTMNSRHSTEATTSFLRALAIPCVGKCMIQQYSIAFPIYSVLLSLHGGYQD